MQEVTIEMVPYRDSVIVSPIPIPTQTRSGIAIVSHEDQSRLIRQVFPDRGIVRAVGAAVRESICVGNTVIYGRWGGTAIWREEGTLMHLREEDCFAVMIAPLVIHSAALPLPVQTEQPAL